MKKSISLLLILLIGLTGTMAQTTGKSTLIKPANYKNRVTILVSGKTSYYYSLSSEKASVISVNGPGKLRIITRARLSPTKESKATYQIRYVVNGGIPQYSKISGATRAEAASYAGDISGVPAQGKEIEIALGRGSHTIEFFLSDASVHVEARYLFTPTKGQKLEWISYSPNAPSEPVELISKETNVKYYRFSKQKPLKVEITGPTELRVLTRIENHFNMKGRIHYRLQVRDNDAILNTYQLSSTHSEEAVYRDNSKLIPGKPCEFVIEVPKGKHVYEIYPLDEDKNTVLGRMLIPKKDVKLGK
ncbi:MAG: hypothetical protein IH598_01340 [Bacteroidales bacterium]|nr:hypothetical protein [Bacteroidales bacterium]